MNRKQLTIIILIAFFVGALGSILLGRFTLPYLSRYQGLSWLSKLSTTSPIVINRREEVHLNEGANLIDLAKQAGNYTVSFYKGVLPNYKFVGNGIIMSSDGLIFTTKEVGAAIPGKLIAILDNGNSYEATISAMDPRSDLAIVKISATNLTVASLDDARKLQTGQRVLGVGPSSREQFHKFLTGYVTKGMANTPSLERVFLSQAFEETIDTDAQITKDYFGGPLLNLEGKVVGMMGQANSNILPSENLQSALSSYLATGKIVRPFIGIRYLSLSTSLAKLLNYSTSGILVVAVDENSAAKLAGIVPNDFITAVDDRAIDDKNSFEYLFNNHPVSPMKLKLIRAGQEMELIVTPSSN